MINKKIISLLLTSLLLFSCKNKIEIPINSSIEFVIQDEEIEFKIAKISVSNFVINLLETEKGRKSLKYDLEDYKRGLLMDETRTFTFLKETIEKDKWTLLYQEKDATRTSLNVNVYLQSVQMNCSARSIQNKDLDQITSICHSLK